MNKNAVYILVFLAIVLVGAFSLWPKNSDNSGNVDLGTGEAQKIVLSEKNANYYPGTISVKAGQPVELTLDSSVKGCLRSFVIKDFGVAQYAQTPKDTIKFTPTKRGTFTFACSMGMGYGKIIVE